MATTYPENYTKQLQRLEALLNDSYKTYQHAIDHVQSADLKELLRSVATERESILAELKSRIRSMGGDPEHDETGFLATLQRGWQGIKAAAAGSGDQGVLDSCRSSDVEVLNGYDDVLQGTILEDTELKTFLASQRLTINNALIELDARYFKLFKSDPSF
ncbi:PA2169 family four-helix-bundle protein [Pedobacter sp. SYSU D00535]|uniref:ferritin-like domain-containing protein n=1 Tax=Pedobacter sp. SYSU D00535 TaxID=2810308 RepID=UPI001A97A05D|nr:PA2169 family four-helix-bundle protein [Pedobacter sp. SYSU D00535]